VKGWLSSDHAAYLAPVVLEAAAEYELLVDTGFNGHLYIPEDTIETWGLPFVLTVPISLADQSTVIADVYEATIVWFDVSVRAVVVAGPSACEALLGMELLEGCRLELDKVQGEVRLEQL